MTIATPTQTPVKTVKDVLLNAARIIEERGWCQDEYEQDGAVCLMGAIYAADGKHYWDGLSPLAVNAVDRLCWSLDTGAPAGWNDKSGRTATEVIAALRAAADAA